MNKIFITIIASLMLTTAGTTLAQEYDGETGNKRHQQQRGMQMMLPIERLMRAIRHLDLDESQKESIRAIMRGLKEEVRPIRLETKAGHRQLKALIKADNFDENAVAELAQEAGNRAAEATLITAKALSAVFSQLTQEQRNELDAMAEERKQRRG